MEEIINGPGLKTILDNKGLLNIIIEPENAPFSPPGYIVYEVENKNEQLINTHKCIFQLSDGMTSLMNDSMLEIGCEPLSNTMIKDSQEYLITLINNEKGRLGSLQVECKNSSWVFQETNQKLFQVGTEIINNISVQYTIPLYFSSFVVLHNNLSHYSFIDKKTTFHKFEGILLEPMTDFNLWSHASGSIRKAINSVDPMAKYLYYYIAIESMRACIRKELGLRPGSEGRIKHSEYKEPRLEQSTTINNAKERFNIKFNTEIYNLLFNHNSDFRKYRNMAAHTISKYDNEYRLTTNLDHYLDYTYGSTYLNIFFSEYLKKLVELTS
ncbi:hypothetical protein [Peribacillus frigoritolerans]|uniref:hypothetical protein n=1 Tax=Peribacillus frigoritolerans TaxID=450367 RepID=UPI0025A127F5|nr:hypothetical protein [Peribacillus frigoritolerans]MDM5306358.1 hypothetical protein [Peribacillus frigoritolerans]